MDIFIEVTRFNPEKDKEPYLQKYQLQIEKTQRVLDALMYIVRDIDGTLGFRKSCAHGAGYLHNRIYREVGDQRCQGRGFQGGKG